MSSLQRRVRGRTGSRSSSERPERSLATGLVLRGARLGRSSPAPCWSSLAAVVYVETASEDLPGAGRDGGAGRRPRATPVLAALPVLHQSGRPDRRTSSPGRAWSPREPVAAAVGGSSLHLKMSAGRDALGDVQASPIGQASLVAVQATASSPQLGRSSWRTAFVDADDRPQHGVACTPPSRSELPIARGVSSRRSSRPHSATGREASVRRWTSSGSCPAAERSRRWSAPHRPALPTAPSSPKTKLSLVAGLDRRAAGRASARPSSSTRSIPASGARNSCATGSSLPILATDSPPAPQQAAAAAPTTGALAPAPRRATGRCGR